MDTPLDIVANLKNWIMNSDGPHRVYNAACSDGNIYYTVTVLGCPESYKLFIHSYEHDNSTHEFYLRNANTYCYKVPETDAKPVIRNMVINRIIEDLHVVPIMDDNLCFYLNGARYRLDCCQGMTHILLIFQVDEVGTPKSGDFICCETTIESGKPIPKAVYEYLTNEQIPENN